MISWSKEAMTPRHISRALAVKYEAKLTKGVPEDQSQFRDLFPFLAKLQEGGLACSGLHKLRDPLQHAPVLIRDSILTADPNLCAQIICRSSWNSSAAPGDSSPVVTRNAVVVLLLLLLLRSLNSSGLGLSLSLLMLDLLRRMVIGVLVVALHPFGRELLLVLEIVLHLVLRLWIA
jgi:hypothetical protein